MATWWRPIAFLVLPVATWIGCSHDSDDGPSGKPANDAGAAGERASGGTGGEGGAADAGSDEGGAAGTASGGMDEIGGGSGAAGTSGRGETAGAPVPAGVPAEWACNYFAYGDGTCDCGCGAPDEDCTEEDLTECEVCNGAGSCSVAECPGRIDPEDTSRCTAPPEGWTCSPVSYGDGTCDCGCGIVDEDCPNTEVASCEECTAEGSCANGPCPSTLSADDNTRCEIPPRWTCDRALYGDGTCHCGCGVVDIDCPDESDASCEVCDRSSCSPFGCAVEPDDNAHCPEPPPVWKCSARLYHDGSRCDCGCGAIDPDCESLGVDACDKCDAPGSCSAQPCPSFINAESNDRCDVPAPPPGWTCAAAAYGDGIECDCGCGVADPDCRDAEFTTCVRCLSCGGHGACEGTVDPADTTQCAPPPSGWTCSAEHYRDAVCDCGCGIPDSYCQNIELLYVCGNYPVEGCSAGNRAHIDPNHNALCIINVPGDWTCDRSYYDDGLCDCGCGTVDLDCPSNDVSDCEACDDEGSCSSTECPGTIVPDDSAHCSN